jgi:hypothetical protein
VPKPSPVRSPPQGWRASKLVVYANGSIDDPAKASAHVAAGWSIEKSDGSPHFDPVNREQWDWPRLLELLADPGRRAALGAVVATNDLSIGDDIGGGFIPKGAVMGFRARVEDGELVLRKTDGGRLLASGWDAVLDRLSTLNRTAWHDLHIWREWPAEEAIAMGQPFALREVAPVLTDVARVYLDTVWPGRRATVRM